MLADRRILAKIVSAASTEKDEIVLEAGTGQGILTAELCRCAKHVISNLPYSRSRDAIEWLSRQKFKRAILMVQDEFADKLASRPGSKSYRAISALAAHCFTIEKLFKVRRESFEPQPKVQSSIIRIIPINTVTREVIRNINLLFSRRNKNASSVAAEAGIINAIYESKKIDALEPKDLVHMAELMSSNVRTI
jgi:16S rRNA (adenine1518-N6/adenine1519-N6)-dimethyltransferase